MYGATRTTTTLIGIALAGALLWLGDQVLDPESPPGAWDYWSWAGLCALAGLVLAGSQVLGGWTRRGWPRLSKPVTLGAFLPLLIVGGWIIAAFDPSESWLQEHVGDWSRDLGVEGLVTDLGASILNVSAIAVVIGLVLGFSIDTAPRRAVRSDEDGRAVPEAPAVAGAGFAGQAEAREHDESETRIVHAGQAEAREDDESETRIVHADPAEERPVADAGGDVEEPAADEEPRPSS